MQKPYKIFAQLLLAQMICLLLGLWMHDRLVMATSEWSDSKSLTKVEQIEEAMPAVLAISFVWIGALQAIALYLIVSRLRGNFIREQRQLDTGSIRRANDLIRTRDAVIFGLAKLAESRDPETGNHLERISLYSTHLASALRSHPKYQSYVNSTFVSSIGFSSALHDIGKVAIEDSILLKPGKLTANEYKKMQEHALVGARCLQEIEKRLGESNFLGMAREIACSHHERWDGTGYPHGLQGEDIPLTARIVAIADVYDALSSRRVYKGPIPHLECVKMICADAGTHFDPHLVEVFLKVESNFHSVAKRMIQDEEKLMPVSADEVLEQPLFEPRPAEESAEEIAKTALEPATV